MYPKIILSIVGLLIILILSEVLYLFVFKRSVLNTNPQLPSPSKTPIHFSENRSNVRPSPTPSAINAAINFEQLNWFTRTHATAHVTSKISQTYEGVVFELNKGDFKDDKDNISTVYELYLTDDKTTDKALMNSFIITDNVLEIADLNDVISKSQFQITDLKAGDRISIELTIDLTKPTGFGFEKFEINRAL